jgi:predicted transcriptional regulator
MTKKSKSAGPEKLLTEVELELMSILWKLGEGSVADVIEQLPPGRDLAYTSVSTILRILEQKDVLKTRKEGRGHVYIPKLKKADYESKTVRHVVDKVFDGTPVALVKQLLSSVKIDDDELAELRRLVSEMGKSR